MMSGSMAFFAWVFIVGQIIASVIQGGGFASGLLAADITDASVTMQVADTTNSAWLGASVSVPAYLLIKGSDSEVVSYTGKSYDGVTKIMTFSGLGRGVADPQTGERYDAAVHSSGSKVMTTNIGAIDSFVGYSVGTAQGVIGSVKVVVASGVAILKNLPRMLLWDYPWLQGQATVFRFPLFALSAGFVWALFMSMLQLAQGILRVL